MRSEGRGDVGGEETEEGGLGEGGEGGGWFLGGEEGGEPLRGGVEVFGCCEVGGEVLLLLLLGGGAHFWGLVVMGEVCRPGVMRILGMWKGRGFELRDSGPLLVNPFRYCLMKTMMDQRNEKREGRYVDVDTYGVGTWYVRDLHIVSICLPASRTRTSYSAIGANSPTSINPIGY